MGPSYFAPVGILLAWNKEERDCRSSEPLRFLSKGGSVVTRFKMLASASAIASLSIMATLGGSLAQDATPAADISPNPEDCVVANVRTVEELQAIYGTPAPAGAGEATSMAEMATPDITKLPTGTPADAETVAAIEEWAHINFACGNAGYYLAGLSMVTEDMIRNAVGEAVYDEDLIAALEASPVPLPEDQQTDLIGVRNVIVLEDGRVGALIDYEAHSGQTEGINGKETDFFIFKQVDGVWLLDEVYQNMEGLYGPEATPAA
jgi:hypothetical protein